MLISFIRLIGRIGIFLLTAQLIVRLRPSAKYEKYLRFLVGCMVLLLAFNEVTAKARTDEMMEGYWNITEEWNLPDIDLQINAEDILADRTIDQLMRQEEIGDENDG